MSIPAFLLHVCWNGFPPRKKELASCSVWVVSPRPAVPARLLPSASDLEPASGCKSSLGFSDPAFSTSDLCSLVLWDHHLVGCSLEELGVLGPPPTTSLRCGSYSWTSWLVTRFILPQMYRPGPVPFALWLCLLGAHPLFCPPHGGLGGVVQRIGSHSEGICLEKFLVVRSWGWVLLALHVCRLGTLLSILW